MFPQRQQFIRYLKDFANKSRVRVLYNTDVANITRITQNASSSSDDDAKFTMIDQRRQVYKCRLLPRFLFRNIFLTDSLLRLHDSAGSRGVHGNMNFYGNVISMGML